MRTPERDQKEVSVVLRARAEIALSAILAIATIVTAVWPSWIETVFGFDPDGGNGQAEWLIVAALAAVTLAAAMLARRDLRAVRSAACAGRL
jgi:hypothetical protein